MQMSRFIRTFVFAMGLGLVLVGMNNCSGANSGFGSITAYCNASCQASLYSSPTLFLYTQGFVIPKNKSHLASCGIVSSTAPIYYNSRQSTYATNVSCNGSATPTSAYSGVNVWGPLPSSYTPSCVGGSGICDGNQPSSTVESGVDVYYRQQIVLSGVCTTGLNAYNNITYSVSSAGVTYNYDMYGNSYSNYSTVCDNGIFSLVITPPPDALNNPATSTTNQSGVYTLNLSINTGASANATLTATTFSTSFYAEY
jgi:hypothetical protein